MPLPVAIGRFSGWLHGADHQHGVLLCGTQGFEAYCAYQSWRVLADIIAEKGAQVLRFDYPGEGDSLDLPQNHGKIAASLHSIQDAIAWMRHERGVNRITLVGCRLGCLLAMEILKNTPAIERLVLIAPPASGTAYIRETKMTARLFSTLGKPAVDSHGDPMICGHVLAKSTQQELTALCYEALPYPVSCLIVSGDGTDPAIGEILTRDAGTFTLLPFEGAAGMLAPPTAAITPLDDFKAIADWIAQGVESDPCLAPKAPNSEIIGEHFIERRQFFGPSGTLAGVFCQPLTPTPNSATILMVNAGANPHTGWARMSVDHARALASAGIASLRMDCTGIGDSVWFESGPRPLIYSQQHIEDVNAAIDFLHEQGATEVIPIGLCAGGFVSFHALHRNKRIKTAFSVNMLRMLWHEHDTLDVAERALNQSSQAYSARAFSGAAWKRILTGDVSPSRVWSIVKLLASKRISKLITPICDLLAIELNRHPDALTAREMLRSISLRGAKLIMVYADQDPGIDELDRLFGPGAKYVRALPGFDLQIVADTDHEFTPLAARDALLDLMKQHALAK